MVSNRRNELDRTATACHPTDMLLRAMIDRRGHIDLGRVASALCQTW
jgi:hypothetical protein